MMGDALGDKNAACANHVLFYPIEPKRELQCWKYFYENTMKLFFKHQYTSETEKQHIELFEKILNNQPPWLIHD